MVSYFSGFVFGKVLCLFLVLLLFLSTVNLYVWLSGINIKTVNLLGEITLGMYCLLIFATLYIFCNHAHYVTNIVRCQKILFEYINGEVREKTNKMQQLDVYF